jgi:hypothetical protein
MEDRAGCRGFCTRCGRDHSLPSDPALEAAEKLTSALDAAGRIDIDVPRHQADPRCSTEYLFGPARGKMFGVLVGRGRSGERIVLKAFSGQYNGLWQVQGWAGPLFDLAAFHRVHDQEERMIKELGRRIECSVGAERRELAARRRARSQALMAAIHALYRVRSFSGREAGLTDIFAEQGLGVPTGAGDCCAPRLLQQAMALGVRPLGLVEFYRGAANPSASRIHGEFYPSCRTKCYPLLGFMLCGLEGER